MSDKPATNEPQVPVKLPAKAGESISEAKIAAEKNLAQAAQIEATKRLLASAAPPLVAHHPADSTPAKPHAEESSWSFSSLTTKVENAVGGLLKPAENSLPVVQFVADKPAAPAAAAPIASSEHASLIERAVGAVTNFDATKKAAVDYYHQFTSGKMSTTDKLLAAGTVGIAALAVVAPEAKGGLKAFKVLKGLEGLEGDASAITHGFQAVSRTEGSVGLASLRALKEEKSTFTAATKSSEFRFASAEATPGAAIKPFVAAKPDALSGLNLGNETSGPRFVAGAPKPKPFVHAAEPEVHVGLEKPFVAKPFVAQDTHLAAGITGPEAKAVLTPKPTVLDTPAVRVVEPGAAARVEPPRPIITRVEPAEPLKSLPSRIEGVARPKGVVSSPIEGTSTARPSELRTPAPVDVPAASRLEAHTPVDVPAASRLEAHTPVDAPAASRLEAHTPVDVPAASRLEAHTPVDVPAASRLEAHTPVDVPAASRLEAHTPVDVPAASRLEAHTPIDVPAASRLEAHTPVDVPAASRLEAHTPVDVPAASRLEAHTPVDVPAASRLEAHTPVDVPAASRLEAHTPVDVPAASRLEAHAPVDAPVAPRLEAHTPVDVPAASRFEAHTPVDAPVVSRLEGHAPVDAPVAPRLEGHAPVDAPVAPRLEAHTPVDVPAASRFEAHTPVDAPVVSRLEGHAPVDVPAASRLEAHTPVDAPVVSRLEGHAPVDVPAASRLEAHAPVDAPVAPRLEAHAPVDAPVAPRLEVHTPVDAPVVSRLEAHAPVDATVAPRLDAHVPVDAPVAPRLDAHVPVDAPVAPKLTAHAPGDVPAISKFEAIAPAEVPKRAKLEATSQFEAPASRVTEPESATFRHPADVSDTLRPGAFSSEVARAESTIAETQMVSRSNALAENVHKLELPANASPELQAAKVRLQEGSLIVSHSANRVKVLEGMQADLKVLEKSLKPETLGEIRQSIAEMHSSTSTLERSAVRTAEEQGTHARPIENSNAPIDNSQAPNRVSMEEAGRVRQAENVESQATKAAKPTQISTQTTSSAITQAPHAVSIQEQSLKLLENGELSKPSREAVSKIIQDTNDWGSKSLVQRREAVARLDENIKVLSADAGKAGELSTLTKSVESLKLGTNVEAAALKADAEIGNATSRLGPQVTENAELQAAHRASSINRMRSEAAAESQAAATAPKQELEAATEQLRGHSRTLQEQALGVIEKGGLKPQSRKALVDVVQDSGNVSRLEGAERTGALRRIEQNLKIAAKDEGIAADARVLTKSFETVETSSTKAQRLEQFDKVSTETIPKIAEETAVLRKSHLTNPASADQVGAHLKAIEDDASSLKYSSNKSETLSAMQGNVDRLEGVLGKEAVTPLRENVDRLDIAYRGSLRANKVEETAAQSIASKESLNGEMRALSGADAKLSAASRGAAEDVQSLTSTTQKLSEVDVNRLKEGVGAVSRDVEPAVGARLSTHVYNVETNHQLSQLDRALSNVAEGTANVSRQTAVAIARNSDPSVAALHRATESLRLNGVAELSAVRIAYEKALPVLGREDAININRSLSRIETQAAEAQSWKHQIAEAQQARIALVERNAHLYSQGEAQKAREVQQIVVSPRDRAVEEGLRRAEIARNTSDLAVFKPATHAVPDLPVIGLSSIGSRFREISQAAREIAASFRKTLFEHPVAGSLSIGMGAFMLESGRAMAHTPADNIRQTPAGQIDFSPRVQSVLASAEAPLARPIATSVASDNAAQQPVVRGTLSAEYASLSPTTQAFLRTPDGGILNGNRVRYGNSLLWTAVQSGVPHEVVEKAVVYARVVKASTIQVGQPDSMDSQRSRIFYPPFKSPLASISAKVRKPQNFLGTELVSLANSTSFLNSKLTPGTASLTNPLNFTRETADSAGEDRANGGPIASGGTLDLTKNGTSTSTALFNAAVPDPTTQAVSQSATSES